jgi:hypothetical protein
MVVKNCSRNNKKVEVDTVLLIYPKDKALLIKLTIVVILSGICPNLAENKSKVLCLLLSSDIVVHASHLQLQK